MLLILSQQFVYAQDHVIDSLKLAFKNAKHDTTRCNILNELVETTSDEEWPLFNDQLLKLAEKNISNETSLKNFYLKHFANALNNVGVFYNFKRDIPAALKYYLQSLKILEEINDKDGIGNSLNNIGGIYDNQGDVKKALEYYFKSLKLNEETKNKKNIAFSLNNIGRVYENTGDIVNALEYLHKALKIEEEINNKMGVARTLNNIGGIYDEQNDLQKAIEFYQKSLKINLEIVNNTGAAIALNNIGAIYNKQGDTNKASEFYLKSLKIYEENLDKKGIAYTLNNIGNINIKQGNYEVALECYHKSLKIEKEIQDKHGIANSLINIATCMFFTKQLEGALDYGLQGLKISKELGYPKDMKETALILKKIYQKQNKFKEALKMYELEIQMRDSINNEDTKKASIKKQFQYAYEKQAAADSVKHAEEQKVKNAQLAAQSASLKQEKTQRYALYGGLMLVIGFSGFVFNRFRVTQKQKGIIEQQKVLVDEAYESLHEKNKEVMDSIYYARRIQRALITPEAYIDKVLNKLNKNS